MMYRENINKNIYYLFFLNFYYVFEKQIYALTANFLMGHTVIFLTSFRGLRLAWNGVNFRRIALVFFGLKSNGLYFLFL